MYIRRRDHYMQIYYRYFRRRVRTFLVKRDWKSGLLKTAGISLVIALTLPVAAILCFKWIDPPTSSFILQSRLKLRTSDQQTIRYRWTDWEAISPYLKVAAITSEDQRFPHHDGFDFKSIEDAIEENRQGEPLRGASTISQQVAKNLFLWPGRSYVRKAFEAYLTVWIELLWTKQRILEVYLNIAQFGKGIYGVGAASEHFFDAKASDLSMLQSALLVTALPSPSRYNIANPSPYMIERRNWVLEYMLLLGNREQLNRF